MGNSKHAVMVRPRGHLVLALAVLAALPLAAHAVEFPVSGSLSLNGNQASLPDGGTFGDSTYDPVTGVISEGALSFPVASLDFDTGFGTAHATYQLSQINTSTGLVASDGIAALTATDMELDVLSLTVSGFPIDLGTCSLGPIALQPIGTASSAGMDLSQAGYTVPPVASGDCGGNGDTVNAAVAGSNNTIDLHFAGDFTPPANDTIFDNGFDN